MIRFTASPATADRLIELYEKTGFEVHRIENFTDEFHRHMRRVSVKRSEPEPSADDMTLADIATWLEQLDVIEIDRDIQTRDVARRLRSIHEMVMKINVKTPEAQS